MHLKISRQTKHFASAELGSVDYEVITEFCVLEFIYRRLMFMLMSYILLQQLDLGQ